MEKTVKKISIAIAMVGFAALAGNHAAVSRERKLIRQDWSSSC
jgi:hypothetical protein